MIRLNFILNGKAVGVDIQPRQSLFSVLRDGLNHVCVTGACEVGECGACTVIMGGMAVKSCMVLAAQCEGQEVVTVDGLASGDDLHPLQQAFIDHNAIQCGYCTAGFVMTALAFLQKNPKPTRSEIQTAISGNLCRCTGYNAIVKAIAAAAREGEGLW